MSNDKIQHALQCLFKQGRDPMFITDEKGNVTQANPAFRELYQYTEDEISKQDTSKLWQNSMHSESYYQEFLEKLKSDNHWSGEMHITTKSGEIIPVWTQVIRVEDSFAVTQVDLRERDKLTRKMGQLSRLQSIATLAGGVAHEFNNILGGIQGHLYLFKRQITSASDKDKDRLLRIDKLMERATLLVQNLLAFSKQKETSSREVNLKALLEETVAMYKKTMDAKIVLRLHVPDEEVAVLADPVVLKQHIFELICNAESAISRQRHDAEHVYTDDELIEVQLRIIDETCVEVCIRDNGVGMQNATLNHCLDPFFTTEVVGQGTGLGLSSAASYIEQLHGSFEVESIFGEYTAVKFTLIKSKVDDSSVRERKGCVLLADDDDDLRESIEEILLCNGYQVLTASNGLEGLDIWSSRKDEIDAVVMDIVMPSMDGIEMAREIRKDSECLPICLTTGYSHKAIPENLNANLIRKPLNPDLLLEFLDLTLNK